MPVVFDEDEAKVTAVMSKKGGKEIGKVWPLGGIGLALVD